MTIARSGHRGLQLHTDGARRAIRLGVPRAGSPTANGSTPIRSHYGGSNTGTPHGALAPFAKPVPGTGQPHWSVLLWTVPPLATVMLDMDALEPQQATPRLQPRTADLQPGRPWPLGATLGRQAASTSPCTRRMPTNASSCACSIRNAANAKPRA
jgi:hypothetical protein